jgi:murein DD-endopeptidase MepM/ murein hydrolase activator NlpD
MSPAINNVTTLGNVRETSGGEFFRVTYHRDEASDLPGWREYDFGGNPPTLLGQPRVWFRAANRQLRVEVAYRMRRPLPFINGRYRIEVFVPDKHATVTKARFAVTESLDGQGMPVEKEVEVNMLAASNEWVPLGEFTLDLGTDSTPCAGDVRGQGRSRRRGGRGQGLIGRVRQFDHTGEPRRGSVREISFGPVRWVPLYQLAGTSYAKLDPADDGQIEYLVDTRSNPIIKAAWSGPREIFDGFDSRRKWQVDFRRRSRTRQLRVSYTPPEPLAPGRYRIEAFIPEVNRTRTPQATYTVKTGVQMQGGVKTYTEVTRTLDQSMSSRSNRWVSLCGDGDFILEADPSLAADPAGGTLVGQVSQFDDTPDPTNIFITFGPVRWVPRFEVEVQPSLQFDFPMGALGERHAKIKTDLPPFQGTPRWLENWHDSTPFLTPYELGIHTGADLNLAGVEDRGEPLFAAGDGKVFFTGKGNGSWGNIIVIEHPLAWVRLLDGRKVQGRVFTRYGHVLDEAGKPILVKKDDQVLRGDPIGFVGAANVLNGSPHLHFDICYTELFANDPDHWPDWSGLKRAREIGPPDSPDVRSWTRKIQDLVRQDYQEPFQFFLDNHEVA